ncbi:MAG: glycosyltransferase family 2 protein [Pirellulales bacterium]
MNQPAPRVSIGLPVYNAENYLRTCLDCLLGQTYRDLEIVISDNASTDSTQQICQEYAVRDGRVRYHRAERNGGAAWNFNRAFELSRGEYFKWAAHDDLCSTDFVDRCVALLDAHPDAAWCHSERLEIDAEGQSIALPHGQPHTTSGKLSALAKVADQQRTHKRFREVLFSQGASLDIYGVARRKAMLQTGLHRPYFGADKVFLAELSLQGRWLAIPDALFYMRWHAAQSSWIPSQHGQEQWIAGKSASRLRPPRQLRCLLGQLGVAWRSPGGTVDRLRCLAAVGGFALQLRKWKRLGVDLFRAMGVRMAVPEDTLRPTKPPAAKRPAASKGGKLQTSEHRA